MKILAAVDGRDKGIINGDELLVPINLLVHMTSAPSTIYDFQICKSLYFKLLIYPMALSHRNICQKYWLQIYVFQDVFPP